jgi:beta-mannosidase
VLKIETSGGNGNYKFRITSPVLARGVYLSFGDLDAKVSDNYFDVLPGETAEIAATSAASIDAIKSQLKVISLTDAFATAPHTDTISAAH